MRKHYSRNRFLILFYMTGIFLLFSCASEPEVKEEPVPEEEEPRLVLEEVIAPPPEPVAIVVEEPKEEPLPIIPLYVQGRVMEVEVVQGVQSFLYLKFNDDLVIGEIPEIEREVSEEELLNLPESFSLEAGMKGDIFSDTQYAEKAGEFVLLEQYGDIFKANIESLNYIIDRTSLVQIQIR